MRIFLIMFILGFSATLRAELVDYLMTDMKGREGVSVQGYQYSPRDSRDNLGNRVEDWMPAVYFYHFNTRSSSLEFGVGLWDESTNSLRSRIRPVTAGISFYDNLENNFKFYYGGDLGVFRLETEVRDTKGVVRSFSESDVGGQLKLGLAYLLNPDFWFKMEARYTGCTIHSIFPNAPEDSNISDCNWGGSLIALF
ncbi:MAG: outer membrane beta-barrel protein [Candidatus Wallbacteria bacterium]|nr:outer membrane beta-barrel protein [Candidatus Wallbacteria bacterium]